jgi:hypothetical protein
MGGKMGFMGFNLWVGSHIMVKLPFQPGTAISFEDIHPDIRDRLEFGCVGSADTVRYRVTTATAGPKITLM